MRYRFDPDTGQVLPAHLVAGKARRPDKRSDAVTSPYFMADIAPFQEVVTREGGEISSRSTLRAFERSNNVRQVGDDFKPGQIAAENEAKKAERESLAKGVEHGWTD